MNKYRLLEDGSFTPNFETTNTLIHSENNAFITPESPVAKTIPSALGNDPANAKRSGATYGPTTRRYESLRYYGNGGY